MQVLANFIWVSSVTVCGVDIPAAFVAHNLPDHGRRFISPWRFAQGNYSVNSAASHFIPIERMKDEGYEAFLWRLEKK